MKLLLIIAALVLSVLGLRLAIPKLGSSVAGGIITDNDQQMLAACPDESNCQRDSLAIDADPSSAIATMATLIDKQAGTRIVTRSDHYLHATWSSRLMGFVDDVEFLLVPRATDDQPVLQVRSASRLGKSDLGVNAKRIESLRRMSRGHL